MDAERMRANLELTHGALFSQRVLLALVEAGSSRDDAYRVVQELAQRAWDEGTPLRDLLAADERGRGLDLDAIFDYSHYVRHADEILARLDDRLSRRGRDARSAPPSGRRALVASRHVTATLDDLPLIASGKVREMYDMEGIEGIPGRAAPAADGRQRPHLHLRRRAPDADPRQGQGADRAVGVLVRQDRRDRRQPPDLRRPTACPKRCAGARWSCAG